MTTNGFKFLRFFLICVNLCIIACYLLACILPYTDTGKYWYIALPGLIFPLIFFGLVLFIIAWAFARSKWCWVSIIVLLLGARQMTAAFGFNISKKFSLEKKPNTLRVLQWNVSSWDEYSKKYNRGESEQPLMMNLIKEQDADVLCFEEFFESIDSNNFKPNTRTIVKMGYPYYYFIPSESYTDDYQTGISIFSKYPMIDSANYSFNDNGPGEHLLSVDIKVSDKIFRVFATHLQSVHFEQRDYQSLRRLKHAEERNLSDSRTIVSKLKRAYESRYIQAGLVRQKIQESPYPSLICGDFNDVPNSSTYFKIRGNLQDVFLEKGSLLGRTFRYISPTLRIDYILADKKFKVDQYRRINVNYSDHYPVEADLIY